MTKKLFNFLSALVLMLPLAMAFTACSDDDEPAANVDITGDWYYEQDTGDGVEYLDMEFFNNGKFDGERGLDNNVIPNYAYLEGSYSVEGNNITITVSRCTKPEEFEEFEAGTVISAVVDGNFMYMNVAGRTLTLDKDPEDE